MSNLRLLKPMLLLFLLCSSLFAFAQDVTITGKVVDKKPAMAWMELV
ncbi:MAG: hypothetical protein IPK31_18765 [Chitinophagaceae bacterium]|nr:hypothetical protein [Chitinophagaceae bacterium]